MRRFQRHLRSLGFSGFLYTAIPAVPKDAYVQDSFLQDVVIHATDAKKVESLMNSVIWGKGPVFQRLATGAAEPFTGSEAYVEITGDPPPGRPEELLDDPSVAYSLLCPLGPPSARFGLTLFSTRQSFISLSIQVRRVRHTAYAAAVLFHARWQTLAGQSLQAKLSDRERECLHWASFGKTAWEIAQILSITERTVRFHLANVNGKLDAVSTTQAVALAISHGLIHTRL